MLATISPSQFNVAESLSTLEYALNAKTITNRAEVNRLEKKLELSELKELAKKLEATLLSKKDEVERVCMNVEDLRKDVVNLRSEVDRIVDATSISQQRIAQAVLEQDFLREELRKSLRVVGGVGRKAFDIVFSTSILRSAAEVFALCIPLPVECDPLPLLLINVKMGSTSHVSIEVNCTEVVHFPSYATGGAQLSLWFEGFEMAKVTSPVVSSKNRNPQLNFCQHFSFGRRTDTVLDFLHRETLNLQLCGFL